jgi:hypothetical protein
MATEYDFYGDADVPTDEIRALAAAAVGGVMQPSGLIVTEGMYVDAYRIDSGDEMSATARFGFQHRVTMIFRFYSNKASDVRNRSVALMLCAVLSYFNKYPGRGVLLYNGEEVTLQRLDGDIEFSIDWEDWTDVQEVASLVASHAVRRLNQPLL